LTVFMTKKSAATAAAAPPHPRMRRPYRWLFFGSSMTVRLIRRQTLMKVTREVLGLHNRGLEAHQWIDLQAA
jgi:hypothetical protein